MIINEFISSRRSSCESNVLGVEGDDKLRQFLAVVAVVRPQLHFVPLGLHAGVHSLHGLLAHKAQAERWCLAS